jgi:hypothetical protein
VLLLLNWNCQLGVVLIGKILGLAHFLLFCIYVIRQEHGNDMITFIAGILIGILLSVFTITLVCKFYQARDEDDWV